MADENLDIEQDEGQDDVGEEELTVSVDSMLDKIIDDDNVGAKDDFEALIAAKLNDVLDARRLEIAQSLYSNDGDVEDTEDNETLETETEEE